MDKPKILIIDDEAATRQGIENHLNRALNCEISLAASGKEAIQQIEECDFDLVILDVHMPEINGLELMQKVKQTKELPDIIVITAYESENIIRQLMAAGALDYAPKPVNLKVLTGKVKDILKKKGKLNEE